MVVVQKDARAPDARWKQLKILYLGAPYQTISQIAIGVAMFFIVQLVYTKVL